MKNLALVLSALLAVPSVASAKTETHAAAAAAKESSGAAFGARGQISPSGGVSLSYTSVGGSSMTRFTFAPGALYFIRDNIAVGAGLSFGMTSGTYGSTSFGITPEAAYNYSLGGKLSVFPTLSLGFVRTSTKAPVVTMVGTPPMPVTSTATSSNSNLTIGVFVPVLYHIAEHFYLGGGPDLTQQLTGAGSKSTVLALQSVIGGYFSL